MSRTVPELQTIQPAQPTDMTMSIPLPLSDPLNELREGTNGTPDTFSSSVSGCATPNHPNRARVLPSPQPISVGEIGASPLHTSRPESPSGLASGGQLTSRNNAWMRALALLAARLLHLTGSCLWCHRGRLRHEAPRRRLLPSNPNPNPIALTLTLTLTLAQGP